MLAREHAPDGPLRRLQLDFGSTLRFDLFLAFPRGFLFSLRLRFLIPPESDFSLAGRGGCLGLCPAAMRLGSLSSKHIRCRGQASKHGQHCRIIAALREFDAG
jgi:hypothetical protein